MPSLMRNELRHVKPKYRMLYFALLTVCTLSFRTSLFSVSHPLAAHRDLNVSACASECVSLGTLVRGNEWMYPDKEKNKAVMASLSSLARHIGGENIVILADNKSACEDLPSFLAQAQCSGLEHCVHVEYGTPTMDCIFTTLLSLAKHDIFGFINGDILVFPSFVHSIESCAAHYKDFVMVGRRHLSDVAMTIPTNISEWETLEKHCKSLKLDGGAAIDYFVTRKSSSGAIFTDFPPFVVTT